MSCILHFFVPDSFPTFGSMALFVFCDPFRLSTVAGYVWFVCVLYVTFSTIISSHVKRKDKVIKTKTHDEMT